MASVLERLVSFATGVGLPLASERGAMDGVTDEVPTGNALQELN